MAEKKPILFGAGEIFIIPEGIDLSTSTEADWTKVGESNGEATLTLENEFLDIRGGARNSLLKRVMTSESIVFNCGIVTFDLNIISKFLASYYSEDTTAGERVLGLGGINKVPVNQLRFKHVKEDGFPLYVDMFQAQNSGGLEWAFNSTENTPFEFEFTLLKDESKTNGNIVQITEEFEPATV